MLTKGHQVAVIDDLSSGQNNTPEGATLHQIDIRSDLVATVFEDFKPTVICHHAAQMDVRRSVRDPGFDAEVNVVGTLKLLEQAVKHGTKRVVFASTGGAIYGEQDVHPADETHPCRPVSPYGCAKLSIEHYLYYYQVEYGLKTTALRYGNVYGPRQNAHGEAGVVAIFAEKMLKGEPCTIFGDGEQTRDFVYVADVVAANVAALEKDLAGAYNVGTGVETNVNQIYQGLAKALGVDRPANYAEARPGEQRRSCLDASKLAKDGGWSVSLTVDQGLAETASYFKNR
jgi:UDP-glucose 4-epimerase